MKTERGTRSQPTHPPAPTDSLALSRLLGRRKRIWLAVFLVSLVALIAVPSVLANGDEPSVAIGIVVIALWPVMIIAFIKFRRTAKQHDIEERVRISRTTEAEDQSEPFATRTLIWGTITVLSWVTFAAGSFVPTAYAAPCLIAMPVAFLSTWRFRVNSKLLKFGLRQVKARDAAHTEAEPALDDGVVLYLRAFDDDARSSRLIDGLTEEEHLTRMLGYISPVVAIGRPGEAMPHVGARRIYREATQWQPEVERLLKAARLVVLRTGASEGLRWEVERAVALADPLKLLVVIDDWKEFMSLLEHIKARHPVATPKERGGNMRFGTIVGFAAFTENWHARLLPMMRRSLGNYHYDDGTKASPSLCRALIPVLDGFAAGRPAKVINWPDLIMIVGLFAFSTAITAVAMLGWLK